jgi:hypothetical protein
LDSNDNSQAEVIYKHLSLLFKPDELIEYRAKITHDNSFRGLYFTNLERLAEVVAKLDGSGTASVSYICINPLKGRLIRERGLLINPNDEQVNQIIAGPPGKTARDEDIAAYRWMFVDVDTIRVPELRDTDKKEFDRLQHECSTDEEKARAKVVAQKVLAFLKEKGWPQPILCDSGNGFHILFRIGLENTPFNVNLIADCLKALKLHFAAEVDADIDASVYNPARLTRAYGSTTRKGTDTPERPYRPNRIFDLKQPVGDVTLEMILGLAVESPGYSKDGRGDMPELAEGFSGQDFIAYFEKQGAWTTDGEKEWNGHPIIATDVCLFAQRKHSGDEFKSGFIIGDSFGYRCFSDECEGRTIKDVFAYLREEKNDDGSPKFTPYPKPIFKTETFEELADIFFLECAGDIEEGEEIAEDAKLDEAMGAPVVEEPLPTVQEQVAPTQDPPEATLPSSGMLSDLPVWDKGSEALDGLGILVNKLATDVLRVVFNHPTEVWDDGFHFYRKRIKTKLGFDKKWVKPEEGEAPQQTLKMPIGETMKLLVKFTEAHKRLPDKLTFAHWLDVSTDPVVAENTYKDEVKKWVDKLEDMPASTFDISAQAFLDKLDLRAEIDAVRTSFNFFLLKKHDIIGARTALRKHFNISTTQDSTFEQGTWQERTEAIYADFEKNILGLANDRKFRLGFPSLDNSGMNIGLDGDRALCLCGPASNRKTTAVLSIGMNFAITGKNGLFFAGEHQCMKVLKRLTLQLTHFFPDLRVPGLSAWEGLNPKATHEDLAKVKELLIKLKAGEIVPGYIEPQNIGAVTQGEEDKVGALLAYAEATFPKYQWDFIIIDPLDSIMPPETGGNGRGVSNWKICSGIVDRLFDFSRNAFGGKGCMVIVTAQFGSEARRDIERIQEKNAGMENFDDELESILKRDGLIQYFTTIGQRFDLCLGLATRTKDGTEGLLVRGRDREGGTFNSCHFHVDPDTNYMNQKPTTYSKKEPEQAAAAVASAQTSVEPFDDL